MKKTILAALAASVLATGAAQAAGFDGLYVGADIGYTQLESTNLKPLLGSELDGSQTNFGFKLGYGALLSSSFYLGGEFSMRNAAGDFGSKTITGPSGSATISAETSNAKIFSLIPGLVVSPNLMVYGRIGRGNTDIEAKASNSLGQTASATDNGDFNIYGVGLSYLVSKNVSIDAEANKISADEVDGSHMSVGASYRF